MVNHLRIGQDIIIEHHCYVAMPNAEIFEIKFRGKTAMLPLDLEELTWSLDDLAEKKLLPALCKFGDQFGFATWD